jgi:alpha-N-arabinofuranosidase
MKLSRLLMSAGSAGLWAVAACIGFGQTDATKIAVHVDHPGVKISPTFYGLMTEEINHAYDGGLYGELIQNRSFRDSRALTPHWSIVTTGTGQGTIHLSNDSTDGSPLGASLRLEVTSADSSNLVGVANDGYWGIPVKPHTPYRLSFFAKGSSAGQVVMVALQSADGAKVLASAKGGQLTGDWRKYSVTLRTGAGEPSLKSRLVLSAANAGSIWFREVSLFPPTFKNRPNGNRIDLMKMLAEMKPSFLRLPGGNYLEGNTIPERFNWKETVGDTSTRPGHQGPWGYRSSDGLGLLEFLEWCEDLHMQPLLAVYAGYSLAQQHVAPGPALTPYVQDAVDEIEYVTGSTKTKWGSVRAKNGHPKPFPLTYVEVGNEDQFDRSRSYDGRFAQIYDAIKARWPQLQIIATMPVKSRNPDVVDDHYYRSAAEMARDSGHYDRYARTGPKIFVGEWASIGGNPTPTYREALGDAAWLTGLERNSDLVVMESYAPLMVNVNPGGSQWPTNLIGYDGLTSFGSPSYYVQSIFAKYTGDTVAPVNITHANRRPEPLPIPHGAVGLGTYQTDAEYKDVIVTAGGRTVYATDFSKGASDWSTPVGTWGVGSGNFRQRSFRQDARASAGDRNWTDLTYRVKARKRAGAEGFLVLFHVQNNRDYMQWNVGGWGNSRSAIQRHESGELDEIGQGTDTTVETGRWYDIRIELRGTDIKCYLDDKLITEATITPLPPVESLFAAASIAKSDGSVYLKIVNMAAHPEAIQVNLTGMDSLEPGVEGLQMAGSPELENTVQEPTKLAPKPIRLTAEAAGIRQVFPPYSVTVLRIRPAPMR